MSIRKIARYLLSAMLICGLYMIIGNDSVKIKAADIINEPIHEATIRSDSEGKIFYYDIDEGYDGKKFYGIINKCYVEGDKKTENVKLSMDEKKNWSSIDIIAPDENYDGIFYKYSDKKNVYLIYDDAKGNKQAYINTKDIFSTLKKNKIKYDRSYIYKVKKIGNKIVILVSGFNKADSSYADYIYALCVYDMDKKKIISNTKMPFVESNNKKVKAAYRITYSDIEIDDKYVYVMSCSGKSIKVNKKVYDQRRRKVHVYNYSGKLVNTIDFTKYISEYKTTPGRDFLDSVESDIAVKDGYIYFPSRKGIFRCKARKKKVEKIFDAANSELANKSKTVGRFLCLGNGRFAYTTVRDYQDYYVNVINIK